MNNDHMPCPNCRSDDVRIVRRNSSSGMVSYLDELSLCEACGEEFYTYEQSMASSRAYAAAIRGAEKFPSPEIIRQTRLDLGMTQAQFEKALGVGKKTVVRWERGTVPPSRTAGGMLWLAARHPEVFLEYARMINPDLEGSDEKVFATILTAPAPDARPIVLRRGGEATKVGISVTEEAQTGREKQLV